MISLLVYPNITFPRDLEKDSYVVVLRNVIEQLAKVRDDLEWTILSPSRIESLDELANVEQLPIQLPSYPNTMRTHFNAIALLSSSNPTSRKTHTHDTRKHHRRPHRHRRSRLARRPQRQHLFVAASHHRIRHDLPVR